MSFMTEAFKPVKHHIQVKARQEGNLFENVYWADAPEFAVSSISSTNSPVQIIGFRYERAVGVKLGILAESFGFKLNAHKWISYNNGLFAQPDFILVSPSGAAILIEVKHTWTDTSSQLRLYTRLLEKLGLSPITSLTVCRNLTSLTPRDEIIHDFHDLQQDSVWQLRI